MSSHIPPNFVIGQNKKIYKIQKLLGKGGNAEVYKCIDEAEGREYAIKFQIKQYGNRIDRFNKEVKLNKKISHKHLIKYIENGKYKKYPFIIMDIAEKTLTQLFKNKEHFTKEEYFAQFRGLSKALACLHEKAIHRDIKPDNILISNGVWLLSDYGLCKFDNDTIQDSITKDGEKVGPAFWMSPEANNLNCGIDDNISKSSDVFQLASIFWLIVNNKHPTGILKRKDWLGPEKLFKPIFNALHNDKNIRPKNGNEFAQQIEKAITG
jgi:serine/threonine-protein kinase